MTRYSNWRAMRALIKASLQAIVKSPSSIVFTIAFPLTFILVFGMLGNSNRFQIKVTKAAGCDTTNALYAILQQIPELKWVTPKDTGGENQLLKQGDVVASINILAPKDGVTPKYHILLKESSNELPKAKQLEQLLTAVAERADPEIRKRQNEVVLVEPQITEIREYKTIDFILPGQLSFSLLASGVFGTAFVFFNLRQTLVLKRFFATPVKRYVIVTSEGIARMLFQIIGSIIIIAIGHFAFHFTLSNGIFTFLEMLLVCALSLLVFMGFGFLISSLAKSESSIPPFSNMVTLPQFLLAGTFFPIDNFPKWLQPFCKALPLTYVNDALRKIAFDGAGLWEIRMDLLILAIWGVIIYALAARFFRWE